MMDKNWDEIRAMVAAVPGAQQRDDIVDWWEDGFNYDITTSEGQGNMFSLLARERDIEPKSVPDDIMQIIKGTCWAFYLNEDCRIHDYTDQIYKPCAGKVLTQAQKDAGVKPCPLIHNRVFDNKKVALDYMLVGARKHEYKLMKDKEALDTKSSGRRPNPPIPKAGQVEERQRVKSQRAKEPKVV